MVVAPHRHWAGVLPQANIVLLWAVTFDAALIPVHTLEQLHQRHLTLKRIVATSRRRVSVVIKWGVVVAK